MADLSTVETSIVAAVAGSLLSTSYTPYAIATSDTGATSGMQFRCMRGWPIDTQLNLDLRAGIVTLTVFSMPGTRNTTRFLRQMTTTVTDVPVPTMTATLVGKVVTFLGTASTNEVIAVSIPSAGFTVRLAANDTPSTVAAKFVVGLPGIASAVGPVLTLTTSAPVRVDIGCDVRIDTEVHRQEGMWKVSVWSPTTEKRDTFSGQIDSSIQFIDRFFFNDGSCSGPIVGAGGMVNDIPQKEGLWRRDLHYCIEYPTEYVQIVPVMTLGEVIDNEHFFAFV